jgi:hypothetical protein
MTKKNKQQRIEDVLQYFDRLQWDLVVREKKVLCGCYGVKCPAYDICDNANTPCSTYLRRYINGKVR